MIIVKIIGGLGNQMFQYAYAKALEQKGYNIKIDITAFETYKLHGGYQLDKYNINLNQSTHEENNLFHKNNIFSKIFKKIGNIHSNIIKEKSLLFDNNLLMLEDNKYIDGYFQCEKYFENIREVILEQFIIKQEKSDYTKEIEKITKDEIIYDFKYSKKHFLLIVLPLILLSLYCINLNIINKVIIFILISIIYLLFSWKLL